MASQRGTTLIEAMVAIVVLLTAAVGLLGLYTQQLKMNGDARRSTEATALAKDLVEQIELWPWTEPRLASGGGTLGNAGTLGDIGDSAFTFESATTPTADYGEVNLLANWNGLPTRQGFQRFWNVREVDDVDANLIADAKRIAVIVRWRSEVGWRRVVLLTTKLNPNEVR